MATTEQPIDPKALKLLLEALRSGEQNPTFGPGIDPSSYNLSYEGYNKNAAKMGQMASLLSGVPLLGPLAGMAGGLNWNNPTAKDDAREAANRERARQRELAAYGGYHGIGSNADSDGSAGSTNPGGGGISGYGGGTY